MSQATYYDALEIKEELENEGYLKKKKQKKRQKRIDKIKGKRHNSSIKKTLTKASEIRKGF